MASSMVVTPSDPSGDMINSHSEKKWEEGEENESEKETEEEDQEEEDQEGEDQEEEDKEKERETEDPMKRAKQIMENAAEKCEDALAQGAALIEEATEKMKQAANEAREIAMVKYEEKVVDLEKFQAEVVPAVKSFVLFHSGHVPEYLKSPFVDTCYRANYSLKPTLFSIFQWHNESFNIWSHLIGFLLFFILMFHALNTWLADAAFAEKVIFSVFAICAQVQMLASTCFHWFGCMGRTTFSLVAKMDYTGIAVMIVGSYFPLLYYFFYCDPFWMVFYMSLIALLGVATLLVSWLPWFQHPQYAPLRALTFVSLGSTCLLMIPHFLALDPTPYGCLLRMLFMGMTYICGAGVYATNVPERWFPGEFDNFMASHNIWHIFVLGGAVMVYVCCYFVREWRMNHPCDCSISL